ncbi:MAG: MBL fold metallo-hydrolase [Phycisphaerales bacterium]|nr:MBL fold metallo-hydrolase [Phycisphaerales bacterium]
MTATVCILASSSRGNATAISFDDSGRFVLVDAGISPARVREAITRSGSLLRCQRLRAIFLTHLDSDHWANSWAAQVRRHPVPVIVRHQHAELALALGVPPACLRTLVTSFRLGDTASVVATKVSHDEIGSTAFRFDCEYASIGHATDLGCVEEGLIEAFAGVDILNIESNYDEEMQVRSNRPEFLKRRIMGDRGHLSNEQAVAAVARLASGGTIRHLNLLHLSQDCNRPEIVREVFEKRVGANIASMHISSPDQPTRPVAHSDSKFGKDQARLGPVLSRS